MPPKHGRKEIVGSMTNDNARVKITSEEVTRIVRIAYEKLNRVGLEQVFNKQKADEFWDKHVQNFPEEKEY